MAQRMAYAADTFNATGYTLLTTMMVLAILEHWFLVLPISASSRMEQHVAMEPGVPSQPISCRSHRGSLPKESNDRGTP